jgi:hypothetical protein
MSNQTENQPQLAGTTLADYDEFSDEQLQELQSYAAKGMEAVFAFCFTETLTENGLRSSMRKFVAICWLLHSEFLVGKDGKILTLAQLAKIPQLSCSRLCDVYPGKPTFREKWAVFRRGRRLCDLHRKQSGSPFCKEDRPCTPPQPRAVSLG